MLRILRAWSGLVVLALGCSNAETGTVDIKGTDSIQAKLDKGAKPVAPGKADDRGVKFRNKKGGD